MGSWLGECWLIVARQGIEGELTAWSLKVAEYEHQFKVIDAAQKTCVLRGDDAEGSRTFFEIMEKLEIIIIETMADDGQEPMDLGTVGTNDARTTQSDQDTSIDMSYDAVCDRIETIESRQRSRQERTKRNRNEVSRTGGCGDEWTSGKRDDGGKKGGKKGSKGVKTEGIAAIANSKATLLLTGKCTRGREARITFELGGT